MAVNTGWHLFVRKPVQPLHWIHKSFVLIYCHGNGFIHMESGDPQTEELPLKLAHLIGPRESEVGTERAWKVIKITLMCANLHSPLNIFWPEIYGMSVYLSTCWFIWSTWRFYYTQAGKVLCFHKHYFKDSLCTCSQCWSFMCRDSANAKVRSGMLRWASLEF